MKNSLIPLSLALTVWAGAALAQTQAPIVSNTQGRPLSAEETMNGHLLPRAVNEYRWGYTSATVHLVAIGDPTSANMLPFFLNEIPALQKEFSPAQLTIAVRPTPLTPLAGEVTVLLRCLPPQEGFRFLTTLARDNPTYGMMPYDRGLAYLKEKASQFGLSPNSSENCRARLDLIRPIHRAIISDYQRLSLRSPHPRQPFYTVNGARWPGSMFSRYIRQQIRLINNPVVDVGENHPLLKIGPHDHIIGNPQAPRKIFLYASIVRLVHTPLVAGGIREPLATLIQTGQLALVYRSFHFEDMKTRRPEMITACVPKKEFPAFLASLVTSTSAGIISVMADPSSFLADMAQAAGAKPRCFDDPATADAVSATIRSGIEQLSIVRVPAAVYRGAIYRNFMVTPAGVIDWMNRVDTFRQAGKPIPLTEDQVRAASGH
jgi:hypothetical protein